MKKNFAIIIALLLCLQPITAQNEKKSVNAEITDSTLALNLLLGKNKNKDNGENKDSTKTEKKPKKLKNFEMLTPTLDLGVNFLASDGKLSLDENLDALEVKNLASINWNLHLFKYRLNLIKHKLNLNFGLGVNVYNYHFTGDGYLVPKIDQVSIGYNTDENGDVINLKKNNLRTSYMTIPLALNFNSNPKKSKKSFFLTAGGYFGLKIKSMQKLRWDIDYKETVKIVDKFNTNPYRYGMFAQIGFGGIGLYFDYALNDLFKEEEAGIYKVRPFSSGIVFNF